MLKSDEKCCIIRKIEEFILDPFITINVHGTELREECPCKI